MGVCIGLCVYMTHSLLERKLCVFLCFVLHLTCCCRTAHVNGVPIATPVVPQKQANVSPLFGAGPSGPAGAGTVGGARIAVPPPPLAARGTKPLRF